MKYINERKAVVHHIVFALAINELMIPKTRFGLILPRSIVFSSGRPKISSRCSPSLSAFCKLSMRTGSLNIFISEMPKQVLQNKAVEIEFVAKTVTSLIESQQVEEMPGIRRIDGPFA